MSSTIAENVQRDWYVGPDGYLVTLNDVPGDAVATAQLCKSRVEAQRNEMRYAADQGMPTFDTAFNQFNPKQFEAAARSIILATPNVTGIQSFTMYQTGNDLDYTAVIQTIYGTATVTSQ